MANDGAAARSTARSGMGLLGWVFIVFLTLKLGGWGIPAGWSWWWIFSPLWIPWVVAFAIAALLGAVYVVATTIQWWLRRRSSKRVARRMNQSLRERRRIG